jgi:hypothetical protein
MLISSSWKEYVSALVVAVEAHSIAGMNLNPQNSERKTEWAHANCPGVKNYKWFYLFVCLESLLY